MSHEGVECDKLSKIMNDIKIQKDTNRLKLNDDKTEFIIFGTHQHLKKVSSNSVMINGIEAERVHQVKHLGELTLKGDITTECKTAVVNLYQIRSI